MIWTVGKPAVHRSMNYTACFKNGTPFVHGMWSSPNSSWYNPRTHHQPSFISWIHLYPYLILTGFIINLYHQPSFNPLISIFLMVKKTIQIISQVPAVPARAYVPVTSLSHPCRRPRRDAPRTRGGQIHSQADCLRCRHTHLHLVDIGIDIDIYVYIYIYIFIYIYIYIYTGMYGYLLVYLIFDSRNHLFDDFFV